MLHESIMLRFDYVTRITDRIIFHMILLYLSNRFDINSLNK